MAQDMDRQELAIRYLLGDLSEEEEKAMGRQYLSESQTAEELDIAEDELIDRYVRNELSAKESTRFKKMLLSSSRLRERVEFAKILIKRISSESPEEAVTPGSAGGSKPRKRKGGGFLPWGGFWGTTGMAPALRFGLSASVVLLLIASAVLVFIWMRQQTLTRRLAQEQQQRQQREAESGSQPFSNENRLAESNRSQQGNEQQNDVAPEAQQQRQTQPNRQSQSQSFAFFLSPLSATRRIGSPQYPTLNLPQKASSIQLNLDVERKDDRTYSLYNASLENTNDNRVIAQENNLKTFLHRGRKHIRVEFPRHDLTDGLYNVHVDGVTASGQTEDFNDYTFRVRIR